MNAPRRPPRAPLTELSLLQREIGQLFERLSEFQGAEPPAAGEWCPSVDMFESKGRLTVVVEVPGLPLEALKVACQERQLVISGQRRERRPGTEVAAFLCLERPHGTFKRTLPIEAAIDVSAAEARLADGLLTITLPRLKERRRRETLIPVKREGER